MKRSKDVFKMLCITWDTVLQLTKIKNLQSIESKKAHGGN